ncbi:hypothetical protein HF289_08670 [Acidithiobacillus ferrooxidans]|uniref:hypothetical protein n=1 Tax=Acidithiobacillus ferrooxidans TaxID=920 RepID=UPI001C06CE4C|nr:hypothetical protein [Acidithiobacillus ferrooxidans]MBU2856943.1 hypothetical protein [Acidithiobacillus ferrooxidans]
MIFTYNPAGQKRLSLGEWFALEKWPHNCPADRFHLHFVVIKSGIGYRCGPAPHTESAQVSALIYHAKAFLK